MNNYIIEVRLLDTDESFKDILKRFGMSSTGELSRTILVRGDMPLWSLHYALTTAFGFLNEHLHSFELFEDDLQNVTKSSTKGWLDCLGYLFKSPTRDENDDYWADDYVKGSFKNWRRKKYTPPFVCKSVYLTPEDSKENFQEFLDRYNNEFQINQRGYILPKKVANFEREVYRFEDLPLDGIHYMFEYSPFSMIETLTISELANKFKHIKYLYDYGDGWEFEITFIEDNASKYLEKELNKPVMLKADGLNLVEDVGGVGGYQEFLVNVFNLKPIHALGRDKDTKYIDINAESFEYIDTSKECFILDFAERTPKQLLRWAFSLEWSKELPDINDWF